MNLAFREQEEKSSLLAFGCLHFQDQRLYRLHLPRLYKTKISFAQPL